jgi:hypothetical protein
VAWGVPAAITERLDKLYVCNKCNASFLFKSDMIEHKEAMGHDGEFAEVAF